MKAVIFQSPEPLFNSKITDLVMEIEYIRKKETIVTTDPFIYNQLRNIFLDLDAMGSARVDGNKTGLSKYLEAKDDDPESKGRKTVEIDKVSETMRLLDENINETVFFQGFFTELHRMIREGITNESSRFAGKYRHTAARPDVPGNTSPAFHLVETFMDKLISYINKKESSKFDAIKSVYAHQRFLWIHPFREANGLISRLVTYAMLRKQGFGGVADRIVNPTFSLCWDPEKYLKLIRRADSEKEKDVFAYIEFALEGLRNDMARMDRLLNYDIIREDILRSAFKHPLFDRVFGEQDRLIIDLAIDKQVFQAADVRLFFPQKHPTEISKMLKWLRDKEMIIGLDENARKYAINLENKYLVKLVVGKLERAGFIPFT
ncbi:MAG: Fic family protein [Bacteroidia bacterium]|nr:Fic family protein [Bacteroidia bacterium]